MGIQSLEDFMAEKANELEVNEPIEVRSNCKPGEVCEPKDFFEMITECALCGKLC